MPHSGDFGWRERKHESNGCENDGRRGGDRWTRGQLPPAAGPPPGPRSARGGAQDARSDPRDDSLGLPCTRPARVEPGPPGALSAAGCPAARAKASSGQPRAGPPGRAARLTQPGSADPAADGRAPPRGTRPTAPGRPQPPPARRRVAVSDPRPRARMSACRSFAAPARSASRSLRSRSGGACRPSSGGSCWTRRGSRRRVPLRRHSRIGAAALRAAKRLDVNSRIRARGFATLRS
jgi:hypothetical protein